MAVPSKYVHHRSTLSYHHSRSPAFCNQSLSISDLDASPEQAVCRVFAEGYIEPANAHHEVLQLRSVSRIAADVGEATTQDRADTIYDIAYIVID